MSRRLHLIRHAAVIVDQRRQASDWLLSPSAGANVHGLLNAFDPSRLRRVITSGEMKAQQTGRILADQLDLPMDVREGLEEHHRDWNGFLDEAAFRACLERFFARPKERVFGNESAEECLERFDAALRTIMSETDDDELIVSHGRVISLFVASRRNVDAMQIWATLDLPDHIELAWPGFARTSM